MNTVQAGRTWWATWQHWLSAANFWLRWNSQTGAILPIGLILSLIVATLLGTTGWYGAELIYRHKVAVIGYGPNHKPQ